MDWTAKVGPQSPLPASTDTPMYSFQRPAWLFWDGYANALMDAGWTESQVREHLQSKATRWMLDLDGDRLRDLGAELARSAGAPP